MAIEAGEEFRQLARVALAGLGHRILAELLMDIPVTRHGFVFRVYVSGGLLSVVKDTERNVALLHVKLQLFDMCLLVTLNLWMLKVEHPEIVIHAEKEVNLENPRADAIR